ncbi:hypothetical protein Cyrtocomes_00825 [Candidatus Cyrtobacter comes]|uniref:Uncharacterized protein n=1 Tax=Candidatus Cyrtobacter comes TaxID=675776 RepID=A0ABU5L8T1_9RICK|nr:hypothetical protein [Candidatus Cyrtobacter comes]
MQQWVYDKASILGSVEAQVALVQFCMLILASSYNSTNTLFTTLHALALKDDVESQLALAYMYYGALERVAAMGL